MKDEGGAGFAGSSPPFLGRERAAVDVDVGPERRSPRYHETCLALLCLALPLILFSCFSRKPRVLPNFWHTSFLGGMEDMRAARLR